MKVIGVACFVMLTTTLLLFGPAGGFHHHYGFGPILRYMILNGEDPDPRYPTLFGCEVSLDRVKFGINGLIWTGILTVVVFWSRRTMVAISVAQNVKLSRPEP